MATEESKLVVAVDSTSVPKAGAELDAYTASATKADAATGKLAATSRSATTAHAAAAADMSRAEQAASAYAETEAQAAARIHDMIAASLAAADASKAQAAAQAAAAAKNAEASAAQVAASKALADAQTRQMAAYTASRAPVVELEAILAKTTLTTAEVAQAEALLDKAQASGVISAGELAAAFKALDAAKIKDVAVTKAQTVANKEALNSRAQYEIGVLAGELATGNVSRVKRSVPALLNATGLTGKILSPAGLGITAVVAGLGALAVAYAKGEAEQTAFAQSLLVTGGYADKTADQLQDLAKQLDGMQGVTEHAAAGVIASVVATGQFSGTMVDTVSKTALAMEQLGQPTEKTIQQFEELGKDPVNGLLKLNETTHFLTQSVYDQVAALDQLGEKDKAAQVAQDAYAQAMQKRASDVADNLGALQRAWQGITGVAKEAWDAMLDVGRSDTLADKIAAIKARLKEAQAELHPVDALTGRSITLSPAEKAAIEARIKFQQDALAKAQAASAASGGFSHGAAAAQKLISDRIAAQQAGQAGALQFNKGAQEKKELDDIATQRATALLGVVDPAKQAQINQEFDAWVAGVKAKYDKAAKSLGSSFDQDKHHATVVDEIQKEIEAAGKLADQQNARDAADADYQAQLNQQLATRKAAIDLQVASVGMGQQEYQQYQALNEVYQQFDHQLAQLNKERDAGSITVNQYNKRLAELKQNESDTVAAVVDGYKRMDSAREDWMNGLTSSWQNYIDQGKDVAGMTANVFSDAFSGMENSMVNFVQTGKLSFKDLANSIISDLVRMETRILISQALTSILGGIANTRGASISSNYMANGGSTYAASGVDWSVNLSGGRASGGPVAGGSLYEVAEGGKPEVLSSGGHTYLLMGAQDGYVTPASTSGTSPLGRAGGTGAAQAKGGGTTVIVENHSDSQAQVQQSQDGNGNDIVRVIVGKAVNEVNSQIAKGGSTYKTLQQTFGLNRRGVPVAG